MRWVIFSVLFLGAAHGQAAPCDRLSAKQREQAAIIFRATHPYDCCDETLDRCLKQFKVCKLAKRLRDDICRRLIKGQEVKQIKSALDRRARSMTSTGKPAVFDLAWSQVVGDPHAPVTVVVCACARCPFCSKVVPDLYLLVTESGLKNKVKLYFRPFPIRGHAGAVEGGLAFLAAEQLKKLWPYLLKMFGEYDRFEVGKLASWAADLGLDRAVFQQVMASTETRARLVLSKKEGLRNGVNATPTLFINGRKYLGDMDRDTLLDVLDEEADRVKGKEFCGQ